MLRCRRELCRLRLLLLWQSIMDQSRRTILSFARLRPVLRNCNWGTYSLYAVFPQQKSLPKRTRLLLDFIVAHTQNLTEKIN